MTNKEAVQILRCASFIPPWECDVDEAIEMAIEALQIVRCGECKNRYHNSGGYLCCSIYLGETDPNGFCHHGKRSEEI